MLDKSQKCFEIIVSRFLDNQRFKCRVGAQGLRAEGFQSFVALDLCRGVTCRSRTEATIVVSYTGQPLTTAGMCHWIHRSALGKALDMEVNQVRKSNRKTGRSGFEPHGLWSKSGSVLEYHRAVLMIISTGVAVWG